MLEPQDQPVCGDDEPELEDELLELMECLGLEECVDTGVLRYFSHVDQCYVLTGYFPPVDSLGVREE